MKPISAVRLRSLTQRRHTSPTGCPRLAFDGCDREPVAFTSPRSCGHLPRREDDDDGGGQGEERAVERVRGSFLCRADVGGSEDDEKARGACVQQLRELEA